METQLPTGPSIAEIKQTLEADAEYLTTIDPASLSAEDRAVYDELVSWRKGQYEDHKVEIQRDTQAHVIAADADLQHRVDMHDHNAR